MDFKIIIERAREIFGLYAESDKRRLGQEWHRGEYAKALAADVGALIKLTMAKDGLREMENVDEKLKEVDLEQAFFETMDELEKRAGKNELTKSHTL